MAKKGLVPTENHDWEWTPESGIPMLSLRPVEITAERNKKRKGGSTDEPPQVYVSSLANENGWMPEVTISAGTGLTDYDLARAERYRQADGMLNAQGREFLKNVSSKRTTGQSNFMRDVNKLSYIPNAAVGAIGAIPAIAALGAAGLVYGLPVLNALGKPLNTVLNLASKTTPGLTKLAPYAAIADAGLDVKFTIDGIRNLFSKNGIQKTLKLIEEDDGLGAVKSGMGDIMDIAGGVGMLKSLKGLRNRNLHAYNTIEP